MSISILLADNQSIVRKSLSELFRKEKDIIVSAETDSVYSLFELLFLHAPDILIFDIDMDGHRGLEILKEIQNKYGERVRAITFTENKDNATIFNFFQNGGKGYLLKTCPVEEILSAVRNVYKGGLYLCPDLGGLMMSGYLSAFFEPSLLNKLTGRENEVLRLINEGKTVKEIAALLHISDGTVKTHKKHIMEKLEVHSMIELIRKTLFMRLD